MIILKKEKKTVVPINLQNYSLFFLTLLENNQTDIVKINPFQKKFDDRINPFYELYEHYLLQKLSKKKYLDIGEM